LGRLFQRGDDPWLSGLASVLLAIESIKFQLKKKKTTAIKFESSRKHLLKLHARRKARAEITKD
jgi:hypothetical protein